MTDDDEYKNAPLSVVILALNAGERIAGCLEALVPATIEGLVKEVVVVDGGSRDDTIDIAESFGARILKAPPSRGGQLRTGAAAARGRWLLFLHADTILEERWAGDVKTFIAKERSAAAVFHLSFEPKHWKSRLVAFGAIIRTRLFSLPYGDQGLLISSTAYEASGGFSNIPLFEDVEIIDRIKKAFGSRSIHLLKTRAVTAAVRYEEDGYLRRVYRNIRLLMKYKSGASGESLVKEYSK